MPESALRLVKSSAEFIPKDQVNQLPRGLRGIYVLYKQRSGAHPKYEVLYVGMAAAGRRTGLRGRLSSHARSKRKGKLWTHFSAFEVWDNIRDDEVAELEGLFRHIYRRDPAANRLNIQRGFKKARKLPTMLLSGSGLK
jgi:hypothetical protein